MKINNNSKKINPNIFSRMIFLFAFFLLSQFIASETQNKVTLSANGTTLKAVFNEIEKQTNLSVDYEESRIDINKNVNISIVDMDLNDALSLVLKNSGYTYAIKGNHILLSPQPQQNVANKVRISGVVLDEADVPVIGANIIEKGTTNGTITDVDGNFSLEVSEKAVLVVSYIGYTPREISFGNQRVLTIRIAEDTQALEEVVVVGYGVQRKSDVTGSISVATAEDLLARPQFNALEGLRGKAAGVNIMSSTGNPLGMDESGPRIIIRGMNSVNTSSEPLFVVDGVQMIDFHFVNPNDIERMEVLKDASATAIYGARGANGVILVTTKKGNAGEGKTVVSYNGYVSMGTMAKKVDLMNAEEFLQMEDIAFANLSKYPAGRKTLSDRGLTEWVPRRTDPLFFDANGRPLYDTDWQEETTRDALSHSHQLNVQHQSQKASVGAFLNYTDQQAIILNNYAKRVNAKLTYDAKPVKWLDINTSLLVNHTWGNSFDGTGGGARRNMWEMPPIVPVRFPNGEWGTVSNQTELDYNLEGMSNPVQEMETVKRRRLRTKIFGNVGFVFHLAEGLDLRTQLGIDYNIRSNRDYFPTDLLYLSAPQGRASITNGTTFYWQEETYLTYNKVLKDIHRINATLGMSWSESSVFNFGTGNVTNFITDHYGYDNLAAGQTPSAPTSAASKWSINSYFARGSYTLMDKYMATLTIRADGSSRFGNNSKYGYFPSAGLGWNISNEGFMKDVEWLSNLKLHTSYGQTGNTEIEMYRSLSLMQASTILQNGGRVATSQMSRMANPDLEWEKTDQFDIGINLGLFNNRVNMDLDFYHKNTHDLLLDRPLPFETGFASVYQNMGRVDNTGVDLLLQTVNIQNKNFTWETTFNFNYNKNEIKALGANNEDIVMSAGIGDGYVIHRVGEALGSFYAPRRLGTWSTAEAAEAAAAPGGQSPGESKKTADREILGNGIPKVSGSFINKFNYKNFDLLVDIQFVAGVQTWEAYTGAILDRAGVANGLKLMLTDSWTEENQNTMVQQIRHTTYAGQSSNADSYWVTDGSYIRGNLLQLGYTFGGEQLKKWKLQNLRLNFSVSNAFLIHSKEFKGYDPESSARAGKWGQNIYFYQYPRERTYTLGANFSF